jgi:hypothetical protein
MPRGPKEYEEDIDTSGCCQDRKGEVLEAFIATFYNTLLAKQNVRAL